MSEDRPEIGPFVDEGEIARGGMGAVHRVRDRQLRRRTALKVLHAHLVERPDVVERFVVEAQVTGQLQHPGIPPVHALGQHQGRPWMNMKQVQGRTLAALVDEAGEERLSPRSLSRLLEVLLRVCDAVAYAHSRGVLHLDIKPSNIMVGDFGQVYLMDWGIAQLQDDPVQGEPVEVSHDPAASLGEDSVVGSPRYMSPEQARSRHDRYDVRTDVFLLGATLYHVLAGRAPYRGRNLPGTLWQAIQCRYEPPGEVVGPGVAVPPRLARICLRAMSPEPGDRHPAVRDLREELERFLHGAWHLPTVSLPAGEVVFREGDPSDAAYTIVRGRCRVFSERDGAEQVLRDLGPGEVFGEVGVVTGEPRTAGVRALEPCELQVVDRELLVQDLGLGSWTGAFVRALAERFVELDARLRER